MESMLERRSASGEVAALTHAPERKFTAVYIGGTADDPYLARLTAAVLAAVRAL